MITNIIFNISNLKNKEERNKSEDRKREKKVRNLPAAAASHGLIGWINSSP